MVLSKYQILKYYYCYFRLNSPFNAYKLTFQRIIHNVQCIRHRRAHRQHRRVV